MMLGARYSSVVKVGLLILTVTVTLASESWSAAEEAVAVKDFPGVVMRSVTLWSDGTRLAGDLLYPQTASEDENLRVLKNYFEYYNRYRVHQSLEMDAPEGRTAQTIHEGKVIAIPHVGGLHHHYERKAA